MAESRDQGRREPNVFLSEKLAVPPRELGSQSGDLFAAVAQRRDHQLDDGEAVVEILPEAPGSCLGGQVAIGAGDDADVDALHLPRADRLDLAFLQHAQELCLDRRGKLTHLVEHERSSVGFREEALPRLDRPGERASRVPEELRLRELARNRRAIERHQRR